MIRRRQGSNRTGPLFPYTTLFRALGKAAPSKLHIPEVVTGRAVFGLDVKLPGMVHAALMQAPVHGGTLKSHQPKAVLGMPGVRAVVVLDPAKTKGTPVTNKGTWGAGDNQRSEEHTSELQSLMSISYAVF